MSSAAGLLFFLVMPEICYFTISADFSTVGVCLNMILYYAGGWGGKPKYDSILCDVGGEGVGGMIWGELVFDPADPATHPSRIRNKT